MWFRSEANVRLLVAAVGGLACVVAQALVTRLLRRRQNLSGPSNPLVRLSEPARPPLPVSTPEAVGVSSTRLQQLSAWSDGWVDAGKIPGMLTMMMRTLPWDSNHRQGDRSTALHQPNLLLRPFHCSASAQSTAQTIPLLCISPIYCSHVPAPCRNRQGQAHLPALVWPRQC